MILVLFSFFWVQLGYGVDKPLESFAKAKQILSTRYDAMIRRETFYCGCKFKGNRVDLGSCGYRPRKNNKRANSLEWEHVVPVSIFGDKLPSWIHGHSRCKTRTGKLYKGRKCATKINQTFRIMQADIRNLVPVIGEINGLRSNHSFGIIVGEERQFGFCDFEKKKVKSLNLGLKLEKPLQRSTGTWIKNTLSLKLSIPVIEKCSQVGRNRFCYSSSQKSFCSTGS